MTALHHLAGPESQVEVRSPVAGRLKAKVVAVDRGHDLALLTVKKGIYPTLPLADSMPPPGVAAWLFGAAMYRHEVLLPGTLARPTPSSEWYDGSYKQVIHVAAMTPKGLSGGAWVDAKGRVIGLQSGMMSASDTMVGITFVSPLKAIRELLATCRTARTATLNCAFEEIWESADHVEKHPAGAEGVVVAAPLEGSPLGSTPVGSLIQKADGERVRLRDDLISVIRRQRPGQTIRLTIRLPNAQETSVLEFELACQEEAWLE